MPDHDSHAPGASSRSGISSALVGVFITAALALPLILTHQLRGRPAMDQLNCHEPTIRVFAHDWPNFDLMWYLSATTPLYHLILAALARFVNDSQAFLQSAGMVFSLGLIGLLAWACARHGPRALALIATLAALASHYTFFPAVWLLPDNLGWLLALGVMLVALRERVDARTYVLGGVLMALLVAARQSHLWAAAPLVVACWLGHRGRAFGDGPSTNPNATARVNRWARAAVAVIACVPAVLIVAWFARKWHGLTPPLFQNQYRVAPGGGSPLASLLSRSNPAAPAYVLAQFGLFGLFYFFSFWPGLLAAWRQNRVLVVGFALMGLVVASIPATTLDETAGRFLGLWKQASHPRVPVIAGHSNVAIVALAVLGVLVLIGLLRRIARRDAVVIVVSLLAFTAAQAATFHLWQRYSAPFVLIVLALLACRGNGCEDAPNARSSMARLGVIAGPLLLALLQGAYTMKLAWRDPPQTRWDDQDLIRDLYPLGGGPDHLRMDPDDPPMPGLMNSPPKEAPAASPEPSPPAAGDASPPERR